MLLWYFNHYAVLPDADNPDRTYCVARAFRAQGHRVVVFCASFHHLRQMPAKPSAVNRMEVHGDVEYFSLPARPYQRNNLCRFLNMLDYTREIPRLTRRLVAEELEKPDVIISSCPHPFSFPPAARLAKELNAALIYEVRDLWPQELVHIVRLHPWHPLVLWMSRIERQVCQQADAVVSALPQAVDYLKSRGFPPSRFTWIPNGVSAEEWEHTPGPLVPEHQQELDRIRAQGRMVVAYAGAQGPPNALDQVLDLAQIGGQNRPYHFVLIGDGISHAELRARARRENIDFVTFIPRISKSRVRSALLQADVCFIGWSNKGDYPYGISPKKLGDYFMAGKPVVHAVSAGNDPVTEAGAGISVAPYAPRQLDQALRLLAAMNKEERDGIGARGKAYALAHLEWSVLGRRYVELCTQLVTAKQSGG